MITWDMAGTYGLETSKPAENRRRGVGAKIIRPLFREAFVTEPEKQQPPAWLHGKILRARWARARKARPADEPEQPATEKTDESGEVRP